VQSFRRMPDRPSGRFGEESEIGPIGPCRQLEGGFSRRGGAVSEVLVPDGASVSLFDLISRRRDAVAISLV